MDGDRRGLLRGRSSAQFKRKGGASKRDKWRSEPRENVQVPNPTDTVYRILCPSKKIGSVIGKGGGIIKMLREETQSKITVADTIPGSDERVIMIYSPPERSSKNESEEEKEEASMLPHCPAQDALMRVHDRIIEEDLMGKEGSETSDVVISARLLVPNNLVGCILGKGGDVIQRLRSETGASLRVLPSEHLPTCALSTDELVQIQGKQLVVKRALYEISTLLHQNPRKEQALNFAMPLRGPGFRPAVPPVSNIAVVHDPMRSPSRHLSPHAPLPPWMEDYESHPGFRPREYDDVLPRPGMEPSGEFSLKILCLASKIGSVIGKGGINVRQLQDDTCTSIHVEDASNRPEERVIRVSAFETLANRRSQTIDAILMLQSIVSEISDKGAITTRLLVPSNKVGCLLGQGGTVINEMRRTFRADIRVYSKDEKPDCATEDEELVQVSGSFAQAKDALAEIASRLRARCLRDASVEAEPVPPRPLPSYGPTGGYSRGPPPGPSPLGIGRSGSYNAGKGGVHDYEPPSYPVHPSASRYPNPNSSMEASYPNPNSSMEARYPNPNSSVEGRFPNPNSSAEAHYPNPNSSVGSRYPNPNGPVEAHYPNTAVGPVPGAGRNIYVNTTEDPGMRMKARDPYLGGSESMANIHSGTEHSTAALGIHHNYNGQNVSYQGSYPNPKGQCSYQSMTPQQSAHQNSYQNHHQIPYQQTNAQHNAYENMNSQHSAYQSVSAHGTYQY